MGKTVDIIRLVFYNNLENSNFKNVLNQFSPIKQESFFSSQLNHAYCIPTYNNFLAANLENYFSKVPTIVLSMAQLPTYLPALSAKVRKEKRNLIWSIGKRIIGLSWQTTDLFQQHVNGITTLLLCKDKDFLRNGQNTFAYIIFKNTI